MKTSWTTLAVSALLLACMTASADDGDKTLKMMSRNAKVTVEPEDVGLTISESEHAFIDMMKFYVPAQAASGDVLAVEYLDIDEQLVETLGVAKPLVSVFIHGPAIGVGDLPFAHSFMDAFAAVSLDDGTTWKTTNLSKSANESSFTLGQSGGGQHAKDNDAHEDEEDGDDHHDTIIGPTIDFAEFKEKGGGEIKAKGKDAPAKAEVSIINAYSKEVYGTVIASASGNWEIKVKGIGDAPCVIAAVADGVEGPRVVPEGTPEECDGGYIADYPGGVHNIFHATAGNKVLVAWPSRYCEQGKPTYALKNDPERLEQIVTFIQNGDGVVPGLPGFSLEDDLYLVDAFGVAGSQKSSDFADEGYPAVGEVPFGCVWTARGVLLPGDDPRTDGAESTHMVWTKAERLTSGRRDPFRIEVKAVKGEEGTMKGGFVITWQEDPEGLRPGQGLGPGEGWSGAVAHHKTDVWYSFINWDYFDYVGDEDNAGAPINIVDHDLTVSGTPKVFVPMAMPMRLTNNDKCKVADDIYGAPVIVDTSLYCHNDAAVDVLGDGVLRSAADYGIKNQCMDTVDIPTGPNDDLKPICVSEDGLPNIANTGSTRPRTSLQPSETGSAWVIVAAEESKGLGAFFFYPDGSTCVEDREDPLCQEEIGKNQWYFSFDMGTPDTSASAFDATLGPTSLVKNLVSQGNMLNQPEVDWRTGYFYPRIDTGSEETWNFGEYGFEIWNTEIARRSSLLVQSTAKAGDSGVVAVPSWKQGPMRQGGPADTMMRRIIAGNGPSINPYDFTNMDCDTWDPVAGTNPYYPAGVCIEPATNLSSVAPDTCTDTSTGGETLCPTVTNGVLTNVLGEGGPILQGYVQGEGNTQKVLTWHQCPSAGAALEGGDIDAVACGAEESNLQDQSWYNPLDVSKGHRGFLDGDMVMFMYAWSPNWRLNAKGSDRYDLYIRRSFDGGASWTTTPEVGMASDGITAFNGDGTVTCETYRSLETQASGEVPEPQVCYSYPAGRAEQARNVTQHSRMRITTLDPRYAPTPASIDSLNCVDFGDPTIGTQMTCVDTGAVVSSNVRDPSRFFMVYETGDNSTVEEGEAEPLDLFYSRAINFGDHYTVWTEGEGDTQSADLSVCYPSDAHGDDKVSGTPAEGSGFCNEFNRMNARGDTHSSEANLEANPDGSKLYAVWAQWAFDDSGEEIESDAMARRIWWIDEYISTNDNLTWTLPGTNKSE